MERVFVDQFSDPSFRGVVRIVREHPEIEDLVKTAEMDFDENEKAASTAFAWPERRLFRIDTPAHAVLSRAFIEKQAGVPSVVVRRCDTALGVFGIEMKFEKTAAAENLDDYLLPQHRRFHVVSKEDVKTAGEAIVHHHRKMSMESRAEASTNLVKKALDLGADSPLPELVLKYAGVTMCDTRTLRDWIEARTARTTDPQLLWGYEKMAEEIAHLPPLCGDRAQLAKVANALHEMDRAAGLEKYYGRGIQDPMASVFNTDKLADDLVTLGGQQVPMEVLLSIDPEIYKDAFGEDLASEFIDGDTIDPEMLKTILPTVPYDLQKALRQQLGPIGTASGAGGAGGAVGAVGA